MCARARRGETHDNRWGPRRGDTGLRPGELRALTWADVDLKARTISVSKAIDGHNGTVKPRKNAQGQRVIPTVLQRLHEACDVMSFEVVRHEVLED